jgi:hypothetical protein
MTKRPKILLLLACGTAVAGGLLFLTGSREPSYQGKSLSQWLGLANEQQDLTDEQTKAPAQEFDTAIRAMGTKTIPFLLDWIRYEKSSWRKDLDRRDFPSWAPKWLSHDKKEGLAEGAEAAFHALGHQAEAAVPGLARILNDLRAHLSAMRAISALSDIGPGGFLPTVFAMTNQNWRVLLESGLQDLEWITNCAHRLGTNARPALPVLVKCFNPSNDCFYHLAPVVLCALELEPGEVERAVRPSLRHSDPWVRAWAAAILEAVRQRPPVDPRVRHSILLLGEHEDDVLAEATNTLRRLAPEVLRNIQRAAKPLR